MNVLYKAALLSIFLLSVVTQSVNCSKLRLEPFQLNEYLQGTFIDKKWNGTWITDTTFVFEDNLKNVYTFDVTRRVSKLFLDHSVFNKYKESSIVFSHDLKYCLIKYNATKVFRYSTTVQYTIYDIENRQYYNVHDQKRLQLAQWSPKGNGLVYVYENNLYYLSSINEISTPRRLTTNGVLGFIYNGVSDWVYEEEVFESDSALWFSPDGKYLAFAFINDTEVHDFYYSFYGQSSDLYPTLNTIKYPKVGTPNPQVKIKCFDLSDPSSTVVSLVDAIPREIVSDDHILKNLKWVTKTDLIVVSLNRIQNRATIVKCNIQSLSCAIIHTHYQANGWITMSTPIFSRNGTKYLMVTSESEGNDFYKHLSLIDDCFSNRKRLTYGKKVINSVYGWDEIRNLVYYEGTVEDRHGQQQVYVVNLKSNTDRCLTCNFNTLEGQCTVSSALFSKEFSYVARICSGPGPTTIQIQNMQTFTYFNWEDNSAVRRLLAKKQKPVRRNMKIPLSSGFVAHALVLLPPQLTILSTEKYPLIVNVYAGPDSNKISDAYSAGVENYFVTNRRYIYVFIDGRGSGKNGDNNTFQVYRRFGTVEITDQIDVIKYLKKRFRYIDGDRTGIYGWSYGGFATLQVLIQDTTNVFKFGLAIAPVTNFILYDSVYTERYMGFNTEEDNMEGYNHTDISKSVEALRNKTFYVIHGTADDNVHYQQSMLLCKALEKAEIMFLQQSYPDAGHNFHNFRPHLYHNIDKFFDNSFRMVNKGMF